MTTITVTRTDGIARPLNATRTATGLTPEDRAEHALSRYVTGRADARQDALLGLFDFWDEHVADESEDIVHALFRSKSLTRS